ncbi:MAG: DUF3857 domain-containing transglutaminase family protein [bacterium]
MQLFRSVVFFITLKMLVICPALAQPGWLKQTMQQAGTLSAPKEASVMILHITSQVKISPSGKAKTHVRRAAKILKLSGESYGTLSELASRNRKVKNLKGWLISPAGRTKKLPKENIAEISISIAKGYYNDNRMLVARLPGVGMGDVVAFEYDVEENDWTSLYQRFVFQGREPVFFTKFEVELPGGWQLQKAEWHTDGIAFQQTGNRCTWSGRNLPYRVEEPLMPPWSYMARRVAVTCFSPKAAKSTHFPDWFAASRWAGNIMQDAAEPEQVIEKQVQALTENVTDSGAKVQAIADFVRDQVRYVAVEIDKGRWQPRPAATTLYNRYGDCKDKTALMRAMLKSIGIPSVSVLANTDRAVNTKLPTPFQFNHCIVGIRTQDLPDTTNLLKASVGGWLFYDPTDPSTHLGEVPRPLQGGLVMLATETDSVLYRLPFRSPQDYRTRYRAEAHLNANGSFSAHVTVTDFGTLATEMRYERQITPLDKQIEAWRNALSQTIPAVKITEFETGAAGDSAWQSFQVSGDGYLAQAGPLNLLKLDFFRQAETPALTAGQRQHPIWFGPPSLTETEIVWHLPAGWTAEAEILPVQSRCDAADLSYIAMLHDRAIHLKTTVRHFGWLMSVDNYQAARQFSQDMSALSGLTSVLVKS